MTKQKINKTAFLIIRVEESFKTKVIEKAGKNLSAFIRKALEEFLRGVS